MMESYFSRQIAKQCRENVNVMWLTGFQKSDFRTINKFQIEKLKNSIEEITSRENQFHGNKDFTETEDDAIVTSGDIKEATDKINRKLAEISGLDDVGTKDIKKTKKGRTSD